jgi:DNA invertase Pin-like site-specific DNA recombinase
MGGDVSGNGLSKLMLTMLAAFAEFERDRIGERIRDVKRHQRQAGKYLGGEVRFGFRRNAGGQIEEDPGEQAVIAMGRRMRADGATFRTIAMAIKTEYGIELSLATVHRALRSPQGDVA